MSQEQHAVMDNRVIPVMREAVETVRLVLFKELRPLLAAKLTAWPSEEIGRLAAAMVNDLYGTPNREADLAAFAERRRELIEAELHDLGNTCPDLLPLLTDSLRMQTICDEQQGINSIPTLLRAQAFGSLIEERVLPMPSTFMIAVRKLGAAHGILASPLSPPEHGESG